MYLAVGEEKIVVRAEVADVAGAEPAIFRENFPRSIGTLVIALHDAGAFGENLAVLGDAKLNVADGAPRAAGAVCGIVCSQDRRSFGQAVTLIDGNADGPEKLGKLFRERRPAGKDHTQLSAGARADFRIDQLVGNGPLQLHAEGYIFLARAPGPRAFGYFHGPIKNLPLVACVPADLLHDAHRNLFENSRHSANDRGVELEERLRHQIHDFDVRDGDPLKDVDVIQRAAVDMRERQEGKSDVYAYFKFHGTVRVGHIGAKI